MALLGQALGAKGGPHAVSGQGFAARAHPTAKSQRQWDRPWLGVPALPAPSQGTEQARGQLGALGIFMGLEMGSGAPGLVCGPAATLLGQGLTAPRG